jgi:hypothetical protein
MRALLCLAVAAVEFLPGSPIAASTETQFGPTERISGIFFSNFEQATFFLCPARAGRCKTGDDNRYSLTCAHNTCNGVAAAIRANAKPPDQTVWLRVDLIGQRSKRTAKPQFLGDPGRSISVQRIENVQVIPPPS